VNIFGNSVGGREKISAFDFIELKSIHTTGKLE